MPTESVTQLSDQPFKALNALLSESELTQVAAPTEIRPREEEKKVATSARIIDGNELLERLQRELSRDTSLSEDVRNLRVVLEHGSAKIIGAVRTAKGKFRISQLARTIAGHRRVATDLQVITI